MSKEIVAEKIAVLGMYSMTPDDRTRIDCALITQVESAHEWVFMSTSSVIFDLGFPEDPIESLSKIGVSALLIGNVKAAQDKGINYLKMTAYFDDEDYRDFNSVPWEGQ